jgi:hypothetical protein
VNPSLGTTMEIPELCVAFRSTYTHNESIIYLSEVHLEFKGCRRLQVPRAITAGTPNRLPDTHPS